MKKLITAVQAALGVRGFAECWHWVEYHHI